MRFLGISVALSLPMLLVLWLPWAMYLKGAGVSFNTLAALPAGVMLWLCWSAILHSSSKDPDLPGWVASIFLVFAIPYYRIAYLVWGDGGYWGIAALVLPVLFVGPAIVTYGMTRGALKVT